MIKKQTNDDLRRMFRRLNKDRFNKEIEEPDVIRFADLQEEEISGSASMTSQSPSVLEIDNGLRLFPRLTEIITLHESAHLRLLAKGYDPYHGMQFQAEIWRLISQGAYDGLL
jgi:hypothetical protein